MEIRDARADEAEALSRLALASKAHWGYSAEFLARCVSELTLTPQQCASGSVRVCEDDDGVAGFHGLAGGPPEAELELLYVDPRRLGQGIGRALLRDAVAVARSRGVTSLRIEADPHAEAFYRHAGAVRTGSVPSGSIPGRSLPLLTLAVGSAA